MKTNEIEQFLQDEDVFLNGISGKPAHMDSYMTVLDYGALRTALKKNPFSQDDWNTAISYWETQAYLSPTIGLLAKTMRRYVDGNQLITYPKS